MSFYQTLLPGLCIGWQSEIALPETHCQRNYEEKTQCLPVLWCKCKLDCNISWTFRTQHNHAKLKEKFLWLPVRAEELSGCLLLRILATSGWVLLSGVLVSRGQQKQWANRAKQRHQSFRLGIQKPELLESVWVSLSVALPPPAKWGAPLEQA